MKRSYKKLVFGVVIATLAALGAVSVMAQDDAEKNALYTKFGECYKAQDETGMRACITTGESYMAKYGTPPDVFSDFVSKQLVNIKKRLDLLPLKNAYVKLDGGIKAKNWKDAYAGAADVVRLEPNNSLKLDISILMAELGYDLAFATTPDNTNNNETLNYAKSAIRMIESGVVSEPRPGQNNTTLDPFWGGGGSYALKSKDNALAWMNFIAGRMTSDINKDVSKNLALLREAAPYYFKAVKYESPDIKKSPIPYQNIGRYYTEELNAKVDEYSKTCKDLTEDTDQCKNIREMQLAYADRGLDAYARAYKTAQADPKQPASFKEGLNKTLNTFYNVRYPKTNGLPDYLQKVLTQPLPDPSVTPPPIPEPAPATTTVSTGAATTAPAGTTKPGTTPPATNGKPAAGTAKPAATTPPAKPASTTPAKPNGGKGTVAKTTPKKKTGKN